jgi:hypothetical protein
MSTELFDNLVTNITAQVLEQVQQQVSELATNMVNQRLQNIVDSGYVSKSIEDKINQAVTQYHPDLSVVEKNIEALTTQWASIISADLNVRLDKLLVDKLAATDLVQLINDQINRRLDPSVQVYPFPENSIDGAAINATNLKITGDNISGGVITKFGSTGIDDQATECKVTILDQGTVFENTLYAPRVEVKGGALIDGDLEIQGRIVDNAAYKQILIDAANGAKAIITEEVLAEHQNLIFARIQEEGIDLSKVTFNGRLLVNGDSLVGVVNSQLRTLGVIQDLQTSGESLLSDSLYVSNKRVGVNTMDPKTALSIWDEEVEFSVGKTQKGVGRISTERDNALVLGSNDHDNITLKNDGTTVIPKLQLNNMTLTSSATPPNYNANKGTVVFNENPSLGGPLGWVSLGDARWANFGIID